MRVSLDAPSLGGICRAIVTLHAYVDAAIAQFTEAIRLNPAYAEAENNLGAALHRQGKIKEAIVHFETVIKLNPGDAVAHNNLGAALGGEGKFEAASAHFAEAVRLMPDFTEARDNLRRAQALRQ